jgi:hypothetical protein
MERGDKVHMHSGGFQSLAPVGLKKRSFVSIKVERFLLFMVENYHIARGKIRKSV